MTEDTTHVFHTLPGLLKKLDDQEAHGRRVLRLTLEELRVYYNSLSEVEQRRLLMKLDLKLNYKGLPIKIAL